MEKERTLVKEISNGEVFEVNRIMENITTTFLDNGKALICGVIKQKKN